MELDNGADLSPGTEIDDSLDRLILVSTQTTKSRSYQVEPLVSKINSYSYENGYGTSHLSALIDLVRKPSHISQSCITSLIKGLYPASNVPRKVVFEVVSSIGQGDNKPSPATQSLLLSWLILVKEVLEDDAALVNCYGVLFNHLGIYSIRPNLCHLLATITRRRHVKPWRIQMLLELVKTTGGESALLGLLRVYKEFYPDIIIDQPVTGRIARFIHPDLEWRRRLQEIRTRKSDGLVNQSLHNSFRVLRKGGNLKRNGTIPEVHTFRVHENSVALEEVEDAEHFVEVLNIIEVPSQLVSALSDPLLRKYISLQDSAELIRRINNWLSLFFDSQLQALADGEEISKELGDVLGRVVDFAHYTKQLLSSVQTFLRDYLALWDGKGHRSEILELIAYLPLQPFPVLQRNILERLEDAVLDDTTSASATLLGVFTRMIQNWTSSLLSQPSLSSVETLDALVSHSAVLVLTILTNERATMAITVVLEYLSAVSHASSLAPSNPSLRIVTPSKNVVYLLSFRFLEVATLSCLTSVLASYKLAFETVMAATTAQADNSPGSPPQSPAAQTYPRPYVNEFNGFLMDVCNLLWRSRAFNKTDTNALGCLFPEAIRSALQEHLESVSPPQSLHSMFTLSYHPALTALSIAVFREIEDLAMDPDPDRMDTDAGQGQEVIVLRHAGPVSQKSLVTLGLEGGVKIDWRNYRLEVLQWLDQAGVTGISKLMFCTMKLLMGTKNASGAGMIKNGNR